MRHKTTITPALLHQLYTIEGKSQKEIAQIVNLRRNTISHYFKKYKIEYLKDSRQFMPNDDFFDVWSADMAYILGFIICDGNIIKNALRIELQKKDVEILEYIRKHLCPTQEIKYRNRFDKRTGNTYEMCFFYITSKKICSKLSEFGIIPNKTGKEICPTTIPPEYIFDFIRGLLDGDGSIHQKEITIKNKTYSHFVLSICCSNKTFLENINTRYLQSNGKIQSNRNIYTLNFQNRKDVHDILSKVYNGNFRLERKFQKYLKFLTLCELMKDNKISQGTMKGVQAKKEKHRNSELSFGVLLSDNSAIIRE